MTKVTSPGTYAPTNTEYRGQFVHESCNGPSSLKYIITPEGRLKNTGTNAAPVWGWEYDLKDHLGNVRVVFKPNATNNGVVLVDYANYFPFGMKMLAPYSSNSGAKYLYNGKEYQEDFGLNCYDYGARFYDATLGRWHSVDPKAELGRRWSSYAYCFNNPMRFTDPDGMWGDDHTGFIQSASPYQEEYHPVVAFLKNLSAEGLNFLGVGAIDDAIVTYNNPSSTTLDNVSATVQAAAALVIIEGEGKTPVGERVAPVVEKTYQTYIKEAKDPSTHGDYSGRTSGTGTPEQNIAKRDANHHMNDTHGPAKLDKSSSNPDPIRGREHQNIQTNGGAQSNEGTSGNRIEGISPNNPKKQQYIDAANKKFGT